MALKISQAWSLWNTICSSNIRQHAVVFPALARPSLTSVTERISSALVTTRRCSTEAEDTSDGSKGGSRERYEPVDVSTSIKYMQSDAYRETYGDRPVWYHYRPNHPRNRPPRTTRKTCVRAGYVTTGNPCPICRDNHLVLDYRNTELLKQFQPPDGQTTYKPSRTQICMAQYKNLRVALEKAKDVGLMEDIKLPHRHYDYSQYYQSLRVRPTPSYSRSRDNLISRALRGDGAAV